MRAHAAELILARAPERFLKVFFTNGGADAIENAIRLARLSTGRDKVAGEWFAFDAFDVEPDLIAFAKGVNSGYVPVGGVVISDTVAAHFDERVFPGGLTYSGHPLAAASVVATLEAMEAEGIVENAKPLGAEVLGPGLGALAEKHAVVGEVRGKGVFWAVELVSDPVSREPLDAATMGRVKAALLDRRLIPFMADNRIHVVPPAVIGDEDARRGIAIIDEVLGALAL